MKKVTLVLLFLVSLQIQGAESLITLQVEPENRKMNIILNGFGVVNIDWGDGRNTLDTLFGKQQFYRHEYLNSTIRTIIITGENITMLVSSYFPLKSLDVSKNAALTFLECLLCQLTELDVSKNIKLEYLGLEANRLTSLDVSKNTALKSLACGVNRLTNIDVSQNIALLEFWCSSNQLTNLDVSKNVALRTLLCAQNQLTELCVNKNTTLFRLNCSGNQLTSLNLSENTALESVVLENNKLSKDALNELFGTLHSNPPRLYPKAIYIEGNQGIDDCDKSIAENKDWTIKQVINIFQY